MSASDRALELTQNHLTCARGRLAEQVTADLESSSGLGSQGTAWLLQLALQAGSSNSQNI